MTKLHLHPHIHSHGVHGDKYLAFTFRFQALTAIQNVRENKAQEIIGAFSSLNAFIFNVILRAERLISYYDILIVIYTQQIPVTPADNFCCSKRCIFVSLLRM
jgi:hypothetical protein